MPNIECSLFLKLIQFLVFRRIGGKVLLVYLIGKRKAGRWSYLVCVRRSLAHASWLAFMKGSAFILKYARENILPPLLIRK
jgi:hypothetical protein